MCLIAAPVRAGLESTALTLVHPGRSKHTCAGMPCSKDEDGSLHSSTVVQLIGLK